MKKNILILILGIFSGLNVYAQNVKLDSDASISSDVTNKQIQALVEVIRANGYSCQTVSAVTPFAFSDGWYVTCNQWRYRFEVANQGGKISVKAK